MCVRLLSLNQVGRVVLNSTRVETVSFFLVPIVVLKEIQLIAFV